MAPHRVRNQSSRSSHRESITAAIGTVTLRIPKVLRASRQTTFTRTTAVLELRVAEPRRKFLDGAHGLMIIYLTRLVLARAISGSLCLDF